MTIPQTAERRVHAKTKAEVRGRDGSSKFTGRAVVYNEWSGLIYECFKERLAPGCFDACLKRGGDLVATVNHDMNRILARTSAGTLRVKPDDEGISVEADAGDYSYARDLATAIKRGDLRGMSFIFDVTRDSWTTEAGVPQRTVLEADIYEVSWVHHPAYEQTEAGMRSGAPLAISVKGEERALAAARQSVTIGHAHRVRRLRIAESW